MVSRAGARAAHPICCMAAPWRQGESRHDAPCRIDAMRVIPDAVRRCMQERLTTEAGPCEAPGVDTDGDWLRRIGFRLGVGCSGIPPVSCSRPALTLCLSRYPHEPLGERQRC